MRSEINPQDIEMDIIFPMMERCGLERQLPTWPRLKNERKQAPYSPHVGMVTSYFNCIARESGRFCTSCTAEIS